MKKIIPIIIIILFSTQISVAQNLKRANNLFEKRAYIDAAALYANEEYKTKEVYEKLGDCYYYNNKMKEASKWYKMLIKMYEDTVDSNYFYRYAEALKGVQNFEEADKWLQKYKEKENITVSDETSTLSFFDNLNLTIKRPYIVHNVNINSEGSDFGLVKLGDKVVFSSTRNEGKLYDWNKQPYLDLFEGTIDDEGKISNIVPFSKIVNTKMHESSAIFTADGSTMYFTRNNFNEGKKGKDEQKITHLKIYKAQLVNNEWTKITELPFNNNNYSIEHPALSPDEKTLYFASDMPGSIGSFDLYKVSINNNGTYGTPINLGPTINTELREQFPFISNNNILYFSSNGHTGLGGLDVFKSEITTNGFTKPLNLSNVINSSADDFAFNIDDSETGYFASNRAGGVGDDDIYNFTKTQQSFIEGVVQNKANLSTVDGALVTLINKDDNTVIDEVTVGDNGEFSFEIEKNKHYIIKGAKKTFKSNSIELNIGDKINVDKDVVLLLEAYEDAETNIVKVNEKVQIKVNPIYFGFNKWNIRKKAALELNNIVSILKKYPEMIIEIGAHTDFRGSDEYNLDLSHKRANSVREYLVSQGIPNENVKSIGYGETQPINECTKEGICKEEDYNLNRRCEFVILN